METFTGVPEERAQLLTVGESTFIICTSLNTWYKRISSKVKPAAVCLSVAWNCPHCPQRTPKLGVKFCPFAAKKFESSMLVDFLYSPASCNAESRLYTCIHACRSLPLIQILLAAFGN